MIEKITDNPVIQNSLRYFFVILIYIVSVPLYRHISKKRVAQKNSEVLEKPPKIIIKRDVYYIVFRKKWSILLLAGGFVNLI